jgi:hypothetical protein
MPVQVPLGATSWWEAGLAEHFQRIRKCGRLADCPLLSRVGAAYPSAKIVLTTRDPEKWADSFAATIYKLPGRQNAPPTSKPG